jgi:type III restriction enzyme
MNMQINNPFQILPPNERWAPAQAQLDAVQNAYDKLLPPLVHKVRSAVADWRERDYSGASDTSHALLRFWFGQEHSVNGRTFQFFFSQREAIESVIYLYEVAKSRDKYDLMRYDASESISTGMFYEVWTRYLVKMATGAGKTKVMALVLVWSYFHKLYEPNSPLSKNFLVIAPNIIVLNRLRKDFDGLSMFLEEPFLPDDGFDNRDWRSDFQPTLHIQDELRPITESGNIFLTNIHRVFLNEAHELSLEETFLGSKPKPDADVSKGLDLGKVLRSNKIQNLVVLNDEAHHIHDKSLSWFKNIEELHQKLKLKNMAGLALQADFSATPKHNNGAIFVQTISDYPLVEAIRQNVVKSPVLPDEESRHKIVEKDSSDFIERCRDYIHLGYTEWEKQYEALHTLKTPILFIMTMNTEEADMAAEFLEMQYPLLKGKVLTIHTNRSGDVKEGNSKKDREELEKLRAAADAIDKDQSPYRAVVSVLMLREGWDVRNVTTIVGLRPFGAKSNILPEQTIGRGLRKMFPLDQRETLVVVGTRAFLEFVESLKTEGVEFQYSPMGKGTRTKAPLVVEVDSKKTPEQLDTLDIPIPHLLPRIHREYRHLGSIDPTTFKHPKLQIQQFPIDELKEIVFKDIDDQVSHTTQFKDNIPDYRNVLACFTKNILRDSRLVTGFDVLYPKVEQFVRRQLFVQEVELNDPQVIRNLAEAIPKDLIYKIFKQAIDELTIVDSGQTIIRGYTSLRSAKPKVVDNQPYLLSEKCLFNMVIGDNKFELDIAAELNRMPDVLAFAKNTLGTGGTNFNLEYQKENGNLAQFFPDFLVKTAPDTFFITEAKGREDLDDVRKIKRLNAWCADVNAAQSEYTYTPLYIKEEAWGKSYGSLKRFSDWIELFKIVE